MPVLSSREFHGLVRDETAAVRFLQDRGILPTTWVCPELCGSDFVRLKPRDDGSNFRFRCSKCKNWKSLTSMTWLQGMRLSCLQVVDMLFAWSDPVTSKPRKVANEGRVRGKHAATDWTHFIREVCCAAIRADDEMIGGPGTVVEIDESLLSGRKYNRGRMLKQVIILHRFGSSAELNEEVEDASSN